MKIYVVKNGETKIVLPEAEFHLGCVGYQGKWMVSKDACETEGIDPSDMVLRKPTEETALFYSKMGMNAGGVELLTEEQYATRQRAISDEADRLLESQIPGLAEMRDLEYKVEAEASRYKFELNEMMDDENNDGVNPPEPEDRSFAEKLAALKKSNPRAALYLKAEKQALGTTSYSATSGSAKGGQDAMEILRAGGSLKDAAQALAFRYENNNWD